jgi:hypothetical protein
MDPLLCAQTGDIVTDTGGMLSHPSPQVGPAWGTIGA